jgi:DNA-binding NarL/FixJ family response regulator
MTRILIADDHEVVRQGLRKVLESQPDWVVCGEAVNGREAVAKTRELKPDVLVLDFAMPELNGLEVTRQVGAAHLQTEVLILTMHESEQLARELLAAGARGFVFKSDAGTTLVSAVQRLLEHRPYCTARLPPLVRESLLQPGPPEAGAPAGNVLTAREREVVQLIAEGCSSKEVADALDISAKTVDTHRANLMRKLSIHSVSELVRYALREKIAGL